MALGDQTDFIARLKRYFAARWFPDGTPSIATMPILTTVLSGIATTQAFLYSLIAYAKLQTRVKTATDGWLDMIAFDYFGTRITRGQNQSDVSLRSRILVELIREKGTRRGLVNILTDLTGRAPLVFEPTRPMDTGGYNAPPVGGGLAYASANGATPGAGGYGSLLLPYQCFVHAFRPTGSGIPNVIGYGNAPGAYSTASQIEYANLSMIQGQVQDADIYAAIDSVKPAATTVWTTITN